MEITLDLPDDLMQRVKSRALQERKPLNQMVAELLIKGLASMTTPASDGTEPCLSEFK